jgi:group I intron endonuclease
VASNATEFFVYVHTSPSGKLYVGYTRTTASARWKRHVCAANAGSALPFHKAIRKYGAESFTCRVLECAASEAEAKQAERDWIARLGSRVPAGYNVSLGGEGASGCDPWNKGIKMPPHINAKNSAAHTGLRATAETRAKMRAAWTNERREAKSVSQLGRRHADETRAKMAAAHSDRVMDPDAVRRSADARRGAQRSDEARARMRAAAMRRSPEERRDVARRAGLASAAARAVRP